MYEMKPKAKMGKREASIAFETFKLYVYHCGSENPASAGAGIGVGEHFSGRF